MDRLSAYAARESETEPPEDRRKAEEDATVNLLEKLRLSKETKKADATADGADGKQTNGDRINGDNPTATPAQGPETGPSNDAGPSEGLENGEKSPSKNRGIQGDVKLYEIFYDQVVNLVNAQRLHIQDTIALLVSLSNLALSVPPCPSCMSVADEMNSNIYPERLGERTRLSL